MPYSITTKDGITINNIPDDMPPDAPELKARVAALRAGTAETPKTETQPQRTTGEELTRQAGLFARAVPGAAANLLGIVGDPLNALVNMITGSKLPTISGATEPLLTKAGLPVPETPIERGVYNVNTATLAAALPGGVAQQFARKAPQVTMQAAQRLEPTITAQAPSAATRLFTEAPALQTTGAFGGSLATQLAAQAGAGPAGQAIAGLTGGFLAPGAVSVTGQRAGTGVREVARPFTQEGREVISGNVLRQLAAEPDLAAMRAAQYEPAIPGYRPTTAQATRDVGLVSAEPVIRAMDTTGRFVTQQSQANQARMTILDRLAKDDATVKAAITKRDEVTAPIREAAFARSTVSPEIFQSSIVLTVNKKIDDVLNSPAGRRQTVVDVMNDAKRDIARARTPAELYEIRKDLRAAERGLLDKSGRGGPTSGAFAAARPQLNEVIRAVDDAIEAAAPGYRDYLTKYAQSSRGIESLEAMKDFRGKVLTITPDPITGDYLISQPSFIRAIRQLEKGGFEGMSKTQVGTLKRIGQDLDDGVLTRAGKMPGSDTFKNISTANVIGGIIGKQIFGETSPFLNKVAAPLNWLYNGTDDAIRNLLVEVMLDPKLASQLMTKASVVRMEPISKELQRKAISLGYGSTFGLTE